MPLLLDAACQTFAGTDRTYTFLLVTSGNRADMADLVVFADDAVDPNTPLYVVKHAVRHDTSPDVHPRSVRPRLAFAEGGAMTITSEQTRAGEALKTDVIVDASGDMLVVVEHGITCDVFDKTRDVTAFFNAHYDLSVGDAYAYRSHFQTNAPSAYAEELAEKTGCLDSFSFVPLQDWRHDVPLPAEIAAPLEKWRALCAR